MRRAFFEGGGMTEGPTPFFVGFASDPTPQARHHPSATEEGNYESLTQAK